MVLLCYPLKTRQLKNSFCCISYFGFIYSNAINQPTDLMTINLLHTLIVIFVTTSIGFSQNKVPLNVSESQSSLSRETVDAKNIPPSLSIADFKLHEAIRNNEINKGDIIVFDLEDFENKEGQVIYTYQDVNNVTSYIVKFEAYQFAQAIITVHLSEYLITIDIPELKKQYTTVVSSNRQAYYLAELDSQALRALSNCGGELIDDEILPQPTKNKPVKDEESGKYFMNRNPAEANESFVMSRNLDCDTLGEDDVEDHKILVICTQTTLTMELLNRVLKKRYELS